MPRKRATQPSKPTEEPRIGSPSSTSKIPKSSSRMSGRNKSQQPQPSPTSGPPAPTPDVSIQTEDASVLFQKKETLRSRYFRGAKKSKCYGCRINGLRMPDPPVSSEDTGLLDCGCKEEGALVEAIYVELGIVGKEVALGQEGSGWKALGRPERERILSVLEMLGMGLDNLLELLKT